MEAIKSPNKPLSDEMVDPILVLHVGDEDHLGVAPSHLFQGFEISNLHCCLAVQFISSLTHQLCSLNICLS